MAALIAWTAKALNDEAVHPLIIIAVFIVSFLANHPFQDGNGRLSRVLTNLLLLRSGYAYVPYSSW
jgi:Fic family protein